MLGHGLDHHLSMSWLFVVAMWRHVHVLAEASFFRCVLVHTWSVIEGAPPTAKVMANYMHPFTMESFAMESIAMESIAKVSFTVKSITMDVFSMNTMWMDLTDLFFMFIFTRVYMSLVQIVGGRNGWIRVN